MVRVGEAPTCAMSPLTAIAARAAAALPLDMPFELRRAHGGARTRAAVGIAAATAGMAASAFWIGITSDHLPHRVATSAYSAYLVLAFMLIGLYWWLRRPASRFGGLLMAFGVAAWVYSWESSDAPLLFDLAVFSEGPLTFLTFYLFLAFPTGRLTTRAERALMGALGVSLLVFFGLWAFLTPVLVGGGPLAGCVGACPANVLQIGSVSPEVVVRVGEAETYLGLLTTVCVVLVYALRLGSATRPQRRALIAVASTSLLFMPVFFVYHFSRQVLEIDPARLETLGWAVIACRVLLPLGFLVALWQAELFAARALRRLLDRLTARPTPAQWRDGVAAALDDPALQIGYWDPVAGQYREDAGTDLVPPPADSGRIWVPAARDERPQAAMVVDAVLVEDPELVRVAASATVLAVENGALEGEVRTSRSRILEAGHAERRRIERDLHDSAQQRLVALAIRLGVASEQLDGERDRALAKELGAQVDEALEELRAVAAGAPRTLRDNGIVAALRVAATVSPIAVTVRDDRVGRHPEALESAVYFCCVEALQNAAKHGGSGTSALVRLARDDGCVTFSVEDDGEGFDPATVRPGSGLRNLSERVAAVGGTVAMESSPAGGTHVVGRLPV